MSHKEAAELLIGGKSLMNDLAVGHVLLALVEAQEAANEQARIANIIALAQSGLFGSTATDTLVESSSHTALDSISPILRPDIARALGIGGAE